MTDCFVGRLQIVRDGSGGGGGGGPAAAAGGGGGGLATSSLLLSPITFHCNRQSAVWPSDE